MLNTSRLQTIVLTADLARASRFYREVLGLECLETSDGSEVFRLADGTLRLSPVQSTAPTEHTVAGFAVDDVRAVVAWLRDRGVRYERFGWVTHDDDDIVTTPDGARVAWFRDPDGNLLSVVQFE